MSWLGLFLLSFALPTFATRLVKHDESFVPDVVLRLSLATINLNCQPRLSVLINGTYPGPPLYLEPDTTTWVRVYNDADVNSTIVSFFWWQADTGLTYSALAWSNTIDLSVLGRDTVGFAMADTARPFL